ncbi:hypothetical protein DFH06DRAFT_1148576 [Mycena polygramma]|nr:hypothetical protein DFH06DRAFT_1153002 [Mycena polygramma]KAJ7609294.1 hypothetical protein DFH06DRAFT_1148576 [Mycena polygramma]
MVTVATQSRYRESASEHKSRSLICLRTSPTATCGVDHSCNPRASSGRREGRVDAAYRESSDDTARFLAAEEKILTTPYYKFGFYDLLVLPTSSPLRRNDLLTGDRTLVDVVVPELALLPRACNALLDSARAGRSAWSGHCSSLCGVNANQIIAFLERLQILSASPHAPWDPPPNAKIHLRFYALALAASTSSRSHAPTTHPQTHRDELDEYAMGAARELKDMAASL